MTTTFLPPLSPGLAAYVASWCLAIVVAVVLVARDPRHFSLLSRDYARTLLVPWKVVTFAIALGFFVLAAPYTGDPTWDRIDGALMSTATYLTAPWALGTLMRRFLRRQRPREDRPSPRAVYVAAICWLASASWSYDGYLYIRDGRYPSTWITNLASSSMLYLSAGMMWTLAYAPGRGVVFDFMTDAWLTLPRARFGKVGLFVLLVILTVAIPLAPFAIETWQRTR